jgi:hypothetical protein
MYCPQCAAQNIEGAKFCRACGADISLVPQALRGSVPSGVEQARAEIKREMKKQKRPARTDKGVQDIFKGIGFLCVFLVGMLAFRGAFWWTIWFVIPGFANIGSGIGQIMRARQEQRQLPWHTSENASARTVPLADASGFRELSSPDTAEIIVNNAPPSVTEMTTRHLDAPSKQAVSARHEGDA